MGSSHAMKDIPFYIDLFKQGKLPVDKLLTHRLAFDTKELNEGFDRLDAAEGIRQVVKFN